jgi:hypothetical protein
MASNNTIFEDNDYNPEPIILTFKRQGTFDHIRRELFDEFKETDSALEIKIEQICDDFIKKNQGKSKVSIQKKIMSYIEGRDDIFLSIYQNALDKLTGESEYHGKIKEELERIINSVNNTDKNSSILI